jgi:methyl-accepting chemotaxis protein
MLSTIRARILTACVALVVSALMASTLINYAVVKSYGDDAIDHNLATDAGSHAAAIGEWAGMRTRMVASLQAAVLTPDPVAALRQVAAAGGFLHVTVGYPDKSAKFADSSGVASNFDPTVRPWYVQAARARKPVVLPYLSLSGELRVTFAVPVLRDGELKAVVMGEVAMDSVIANVKAIHPTPASFGMLVDGQGRIVANADPKLTLTPAADVAAELGDLAPPSIAAARAPVEVHVAGRSKLVRAQPVPGTDWYLIVALDKAEAMAGMRGLVKSSLFTLLALAALASLVVGAITATAFRRLSQVQQAMAAIGAGTADLTRRLPGVGRDEVAHIARSFNAFADKLHAVMCQVRDASETVRATADEIASANRDLSSRTESAAANLQQTAASMEEIATTVGQSADAARQADERAAAAASIAAQGGAIVMDVVATMTRIEQTSGRIGDIIGVIDGIAFQTNILALNAAVEAARAGEQGRGFAVVAQEVRNLAQRSAQAAREVRLLVESAVASVAAGSGQVHRAGETMHRIVGDVGEVSSVMSAIRSAANEQTHGIDEVNRAVTQIDEMVQHNAALVEQSSAATAALQSEASRLASTVGQFKLA